MGREIRKAPPKATIPEGWRIDSSRNNDYEMIQEPTGMTVTIDHVKRRAYPGYGNRDGQPINDIVYSGRGWRDRMITDAVAHLQKLRGYIR